MKKIFGIGLSKTGTTSLAFALNQLGIGVTHYPKSKKELFDPNTSGACDIPAAVYYKELDEKFPNSKFIYTIRKKEEWLESMERHCKHKQHQILKPWQKQNRIEAYGQIEFDKDVYSAKYDDYDKDVKEYFEGRKKDLLILNICDGEGWDELLSFINATNATVSCFPHKKKKEDMQ